MAAIIGLGSLVLYMGLLEFIAKPTNKRHHGKPMSKLAFTMLSPFALLFWVLSLVIFCAPGGCRNELMEKYNPTEMAAEAADRATANNRALKEEAARSPNGYIVVPRHRVESAGLGLLFAFLFFTALLHGQWLLPVVGFGRNCYMIYTTLRCYKEFRRTPYAPPLCFAIKYIYPSLFLVIVYALFTSCNIPIVGKRPFLLSCISLTVTMIYATAFVFFLRLHRHTRPSGKTCEDGHDWSQDCEVCAQCSKARNDSHDWSKDCEECANCGKTRWSSHEWADGCNCIKCGLTSDKRHDWSYDCQKCAKCGKARPGYHDWSGCKCKKCGKSRDEKHDWATDCEHCSRCGKIRAGIHERDGCKCRKCSCDLHNWINDCEECATCGIVRTNSHSWLGCKCSKCGQTRDQQHAWLGCKCSKCGQTRDQQHDWSYDCEVCRRCDKTRTGAHSWKGRICSKCGCYLNDATKQSLSLSTPILAKTSGTTEDTRSTNQQHIFDADGFCRKCGQHETGSTLHCEAASPT